MYICSLHLLYFHFLTNYAWRRVIAHVIFKRCFQSSLSLKSFEGSLSNWWLCRSKTVTCSECWLNILRHFLYYIWCFFFYFLKMFPLYLVFSLDSLAAVNYTLNYSAMKACLHMHGYVCVCVRVNVKCCNFYANYMLHKHWTPQHKRWRATTKTGVHACAGANVNRVMNTSAQWCELKEL